MNKKVLSLAITMAMAFPTASHALGLGDIQSNSHLNQPFKGTIQVLSATPAEARSIRVRIASPEVFNRVGIDRPAFLNSIRFTPSVQRGKPVILVSSTQPIHEPFVNFLLEVNWSKGQLLKEYTALLDPPVLMQPGRAIANNQVGVRAEPGSGRINRPVAQRQQPQRRAPARRLTEFQRGAQALGALSNTRAVRTSGRTKTYRVKRGDYLYKVAKKLGYRGVRTEQMMMALYEANPKAFHNSNVNNLKAGAVLQRPSAQQAKSLSYRSAKSQLASHTASWKSGRSQVASSRKPSTNASTSTQSGLQGGQSAASLARENAKRNASDNKLVVSGNNSSVVTDLSVSGNATASELKQKLVLASESLAARENENAELKSRVSELESLLRKKNRLITLKSEQLADFQARAGGAEVSATTEPKTAIVEPTPQEPIDDMGGATEGAGIQAAISDQNPGEIIRSAPPIEQTAEVEPPVEETPPVAETTPSESEGGILGLLDNPLVQGIGGGSLLALLGGFWYMKRRKDGVDIEDGEGYEDFDLDQELSQNIDLEQDADVTAGDNDDFTTADFGTEKNMFADPEVKTKDSDMSVESSGESKEENVLQEADVYLVYGLHDQAEAELRKAIEEEPDNLAYRAKLIENFKAAGDKEGFEKEAKIFKDLEGDDKDKLWQEISGWGKTMIPDSNIFSGSSSDASSGSSSESSGKGIAGAAIAGAAAAAGLAVTAGEASPEEVATFDTDLEKTLESNDLDDLDLGDVLGDGDGIGSLDTNELDLDLGLDTDTGSLDTNELDLDLG
ncbi:MAG TPA: hypothetical protein EYH16_01220, partial [Leucothrix mucor]|nr:hypothetical protein [Leucothrix mucor]